MTQKKPAIILGVGGNTVPLPRARRWCLTLNNYIDDDYHTALQLGEFRIVGKEVSDTGTHHLQGYIEFKNPVSLGTLKKRLPRAHFEKAKGNRKSNYKYCSKEGKYESNIVYEGQTLNEKLLEKYNNVIWKDWQLAIVNLLKLAADSRSIHWYWESDGNVGKSFLAKYIYLKYNAIVASGSKANVYNQINIWMTANAEQSPKVIILDIPRQDFGYFNYAMLEEMKNGFIYSGKYEGGVCAFESPHIICFANKPPNSQNKLSDDRLVTTEIGN